MALADHELTEEQRRGIDAFVKWYHHGKQHGFGPRPKFKLQGPAGSGKSTLAYLAVEAAGLSVSSAKVAKVAYTGKAALVMQRKGVVGAKTIHKAIYLPKDEVQGEIDSLRTQILMARGSLMGKTSEERAHVNAVIAELEHCIKELQRSSTDDIQWTLNHSGDLATADLVVCDEASMVGGKIQYDLESFDVPILYLGDQFQLPPIDDSEDSVFFNKMGVPLPVDFELTQIHRQAEGSAIIRHSRDIRLGLHEMNFYGKMTGDDGGQLIRIPGGRLKVEHLANANQIICGFNDTRHRINEIVREHLGRTSPYPEEGDKLICLKNDSDRGLINGMLGTATSGYYDFSGRSGTFKLDIALDDGRELIALDTLVPYFQAPGDKQALNDVPFWSRKKNAHFDYGYALSCHKVQGSSFPSGIILEEAFGKTAEIKRRWRYTAVTRFEHSAIIEA